MVRSAAALLAALILAGFVSLQQVATHTVVDGDTLWGLAQRYYQNPFDWRRIWEANRAQVEDPNLILPGQVLTIPDRGAPVAAAPAAQVPGDEGWSEPPAGEPRTVFHPDTTAARSGVIRSAQGSFLAMTRDLVYAAPWLVPLDQEPASMGTLDAFAGGASISRTARAWDRVHLMFQGEAPPVGTHLITFRVSRTIDGVGQVATPSGLLTLSEVEGNEAVAILAKEYGRVTLGDLLAPLPAYDLTEDRHAQPVAGGPEAMVMGSAVYTELPKLSGLVFLDQGSDHGIGIGDEFEYVNRLAGSDVVEGRLQVVGVSPQTSAARIIAMTDAVFRQGLVVRLARKMR